MWSFMPRPNSDVLVDRSVPSHSCRSHDASKTAAVKLDDCQTETRTKNLQAAWLERIPPSWRHVGPASEKPAAIFHSFLNLWRTNICTTCPVVTDTTSFPKRSWPVKQRQRTLPFLKATCLKISSASQPLFLPLRCLFCCSHPAFPLLPLIPSSPPGSFSSGQQKH